MLLFEEMRSGRVAPNLITYDSVIRSCRSDELWPLAGKYLEEMRKSKDVKPDVDIYHAVLLAAKESVNWGDKRVEMCKIVETLFSNLVYDGLTPQLLTYSHLAAARAKAGHWEAVLDVFGLMKGNRVSPDDVMYNLAIGACQDALKWEDALALMEEMRKTQLSPDTISYSAAMAACDKASQWRQALALADELREEKMGFNVITYTTLISAYGRGSWWMQSLGLLNEMYYAGEDPNVLTFTAAIASCQSAGAWEAALRWKAEMDRLGFEPYHTTFVHLVSLCAGARQWDEVKRLFDEMHDLYWGSENFNFAEIYGIALITCLKHRDWDMALKIGGRMQEFGLRMDAPGCNALLGVANDCLPWEKFNDAWLQGAGAPMLDGLRQMASGIVSNIAFTVNRYLLSSKSKEEIPLQVDINQFGHLALSLDLLRHYSRGNLPLETDYLKRVYAPLIEELANGQQLARSGITFGNLFTAEAMIDLKLAPRGSSTSARFSKAAWLPQARLDVRRALPLAQQNAGGEVHGPCADLFWLGCVATGRRPESEAGQRGPLLALRGRAGSSGPAAGAGCGEWFWARSLDAALARGNDLSAVANAASGAEAGHLPALAELEDALQQLVQDTGEEPSGGLTLYTPFVPCVSFLAACLRLSRRYGGVSVQVAFDSWRETSRWLRRERQPTGDDTS